MHNTVNFIENLFTNKEDRIVNNITYAGKTHGTYSTHWHSHEDWEFICCTGGDGEISFHDLAPIKYQAGIITVIPPAVMHTNNSEHGFSNIHINITDVMLGVNKPFTIADDEDRHILRAFEDAHYFFNGQLKNKELVTAAFGNLIINYAAAFRNAKPVRSDIDIIRNDILKNYTNCDYELDKFLRSVPFSYDYLRRLFKSEMGTTPHNYLIDLRMSLAEKLLCSGRSSELNISQIAYSCGYAEPLYFSRVFKKYFGCAPRNYALKMRERNGRSDQ